MVSMPQTASRGQLIGLATDITIDYFDWHGGVGHAVTRLVWPGTKPPT
jgi:hypothetical protein